MCVFVSRPMKIVTFLTKNGETAKRVVDVPLERDTFRNKIMDIVEDFDEKSYNNNGKTRKSSTILCVNPNFFNFLFFFIMFSFIFSLHFFQLLCVVLCVVVCCCVLLWVVVVVCCVVCCCVCYGVLWCGAMLFLCGLRLPSGESRSSHPYQT